MAAKKSEQTTQKLKNLDVKKAKSVRGGDFPIKAESQDTDFKNPDRSR